MATDLLRILHDITWLRTIIRRRIFGIETEIHFRTREGLLKVAIDTLPDSEFLRCVVEADNLAVREHSKEERGWLEENRFEMRINDDAEAIADASVRGSFVRWGPIESTSS